MDISALLKLSVLLIALAINFFLSLFVYKNNPKSATNIIFGLLSLVTSLWLIVVHVSIYPTLLAYSLFWGRVSSFLAVLQVLLFFLLADTLPQEKLQFKNRTLITLLVLGSIMLLITASPYVFVRVEIVDNSPNPVPGWGIIPFAFYAISFSLGAIFNLLRRLRLSKGLIKEQIRYVMYGIFFMLGLIILTILIPAGFFNSTTFAPFAPLYTLIFLGMTTYAIVKHRLLDIRLIVARAVGYAILVLILGSLYTLLLFLMEAIFIGVNTSINQIFASTAVALLIAFTLQPILRGVEKITDDIFYKDRYETSKLLYDLALIMAATLRLEDLLHSLLNTLLTQMRVTRGAFILITDKDRIYRVFHEGYTTPPEFDEQKVMLLLTQHQMLVFEELPEGTLKDIMRTLNLTIVSYLRLKSGHIGLLALGEKRSGDIYTAKDISVLEIFSPEAAVAIENAQAYEEIRRFSVTLQEEVDRATKDLQMANEKLKALDKIKDEFLSLASHELRTPMTAIKSYLWMLINKDNGVDETKKNRYLDRAYTSTNRLIALVNDMLSVSRIESGRIQPDPKELSVQELAKEVAEELTMKATEKRVSLIVKETSIPHVYADINKTREVLINLIGNAIKFTQNGTVTVFFRQQDNMVATSVHDTGKGINPDDFSKLFTKFGRLENSLVSVAEVEGTGLGLYISKQFVELSGGKIWVDSKIGEGSTFSFSLPVFKAQVQFATPIPLSPVASL